MLWVLTRIGWAMVPGSFQCWCVLLLLHMVGQGSAVLAQVWDGWTIFFMYFSSTISNVLSFLGDLVGRRLNMTEIL